MIGDWILIFGTAAQIIGVEDAVGFPTARRLVLQPVNGPATATLVPLDFEPTRIPWTEATPAALDLTAQP